MHETLIHIGYHKTGTTWLQDKVFDDKEFGHRPAAFLESESALDPNEINEMLARRLPRFMLPVAFFNLPDEQSDAMKPDRQMLRELARRLIEDGS